MTHGTSHQGPEPTPVADDATATAPQLLDRAGDDYAEAQARREQQANKTEGNL